MTADDMPALTEGRNLTPLGLTLVKTIDMVFLDNKLPDTPANRQFMTYCRLVAGPDGKPLMTPAQFFRDLPNLTADIMSSLLNDVIA